MHKHFSDWYREVHLDPTPQLIGSRYEAISSIVPQIDGYGILELVRLLYSRSVRNETFLSKFREAFQSVDTTFPMRGNDPEIAVLAGATIGEIIQAESELATIAALATICASFLPFEQAPPTRDILNDCKELVALQSGALRNDLKKTQINRLQVDLKGLKQIKKDSEGNSLTQPQFIPPIVDAIVVSAKSSEQWSMASCNLFEALNSRLDLMAEESNVLWWVFGEFSRDLNKRMAEMHLSAASLIAGKELGDLVSRLPGPASAQAVLSKMLRSGRTRLAKSIPMNDAINQSPPEWRTAWIGARNVDTAKTICPIHLAVKLSLGGTKEEDWFPFFERETGIQAKHECEPIKFALQAYRESLLLKALSI